MTEGRFREVAARAEQTLVISKRNNWLLDIALDHLALGRALLQAAVAGACAPAPGNEFARATEHMNQAVEFLQKSGYHDFLARGLLGRAELHRCLGNFAAAEQDLIAATAIAEQGEMRLFLADAALERARLHAARNRRDDARLACARARSLAEECGYERRAREIDELARELGTETETGARTTGTAETTGTVTTETTERTMPDKTEAARANVFAEGLALIIGIANYPGVPKLPGIVLDDARDMHRLLQGGRCGYADVQLLLDEQATKAGIRAGLQRLAKRAGPNATAFVYFSGHGGRIESGPHAENYLISYDCNLATLPATSISGAELTDWLREIQAGRLLVVFDCCHSGGTGAPKTLDPAMEMKSGLSENYYERLAAGRGRVIIASSRTDEVSWALPEMKNSLFTHYLLEALQGGARVRGDGLIRVFDIFDYVSEQVPTRAEQHPIFKTADLENNYPVALVADAKPAPRPSPPPSPPNRIDKAALRKTMCDRLNLAELEILCADLQEELQRAGKEFKVTLDFLGGEGLETKILRLIEKLDRNGCLDFLARRFS